MINSVLQHCEKIKNNIRKVLPALLPIQPTKEIKIYRMNIEGCQRRELPLSVLTQFNIPSPALDVVSFQPTSQFRDLPDILQSAISGSADAYLQRGLEIVQFIRGEYTPRPNQVIYFVLAHQPDQCLGIYSFIHIQKI